MEDPVVSAVLSRIRPTAENVHSSYRWHTQREPVTSQVAEHREVDLRHDRDAEKGDLPTAQTARL